MDKLLESMTALIGKQDENMEGIILGLLDAARSEGWQFRNKEIGTSYEIGWESTNDEGEPEWNVNSTTTDYYHAWSTAQRWGCEYRTIRNNPFDTKGA